MLKLVVVSIAILSDTQASHLLATYNLLSGHSVSGGAVSLSSLYRVCLRITVTPWSSVSTFDILRGNVYLPLTTDANYYKGC